MTLSRLSAGGVALFIVQAAASPLSLAADSDGAPAAPSEGPVCGRTVVGRHIFYNNSFYDTPSSTGTNPCSTFWAVASLGLPPGTPCSDNTGIPSRIVALLPGQTPLVPVQTPGPPISSASIVNYSSYTRGINGIMIDIQYGEGCAPLSGAAPPRVLTSEEISATLEFVETTGRAAGRAVDSLYQGAIRVPQSVSIAPHPTLSSIDRINVTFPDNTSTNSSWVRTRLLATGVVDGLTPLANSDGDRFYFGLARAEGLSVAMAGGVAYAVVNTADQTDPKPPNNHTTCCRAHINDEYDYNHNTLVDTADQTAPKPPNNTTTFNALSLGGTAP